MSSKELDGRYQVSSTSSYEGPMERKSDGLTEIRDGATFRVDKGGIKWSSTFTILNDREVEMISVADPIDAKPGVSLLRPDGAPSLQPITYSTVLKYARKGDKIQMSGQIQYGDEIVFLTLRKLSD